MKDVVTIPIHKSTHDRLKALGLEGDTYDDIIQRLMGIVEFEEFMELQYKCLDNKGEFVLLDEL